jgi:hypothetical protein
VLHVLARHVSEIIIDFGLILRNVATIGMIDFVGDELCPSEECSSRQW